MKLPKRASVVTTNASNRYRLARVGPTHRRDIDLIRPVGGTPSSGTVKLNTGGSPLNAKVIAAPGVKRLLPKPLRRA